MPTYLQSFPPLSIDIASCDSSTHVLHYNGAGTTVYEDAVLQELAKVHVTDTPSGLGASISRL